MTRVAIDTNILAYAEGLVSGPLDEPRIRSARSLLRGLVGIPDRPVVAVQAMAELHRLLLRKGGLSRPEVSTRIARLRSLVELVGTSPAILDDAVALATDHGLQIFDAIILAAAVEARCDLLVSEDLQDGFAWRGVVVTNPFDGVPEKRIAAILARPPTPPSPP